MYACKTGTQCDSSPNDCEKSFSCLFGEYIVDIYSGGLVWPFILYLWSKILFSLPTMAISMTGELWENCQSLKKNISQHEIANNLCLSPSNLIVQRASMETTVPRHRATLLEKQHATMYTHMDSRVLLSLKQNSPLEGQKDSGNTSCGQMSPCLSLFWEEMDVRFSIPKLEAQLDCYQWKVHRWFHQWRDIYWNLGQTYAANKAIYLSGSLNILDNRQRQYQALFCTFYNN